MTRHGAGKFPTECKKEKLSAGLWDKTNCPNEFQGSLRYGTLDTKELMDRIIEDFDFYCIDSHSSIRCSIAITHCDEKLRRYPSLKKLYEEQKAGRICNIYKTYGETCNDVIKKRVD